MPSSRVILSSLYFSPFILKAPALIERRASPLDAVKPASVQNCGTKIGSVGASMAYSGMSVGIARCWNTRLNSSSASRAASSP